MKTMELSRRQFLKGTGALIVSFNLFPTASDLFAQSPSNLLPNGDLDPQALDSWLAVGADSRITATGTGWDMKVAPEVKAKDPKDYKVVGTSVKRFELPAKVTGEHVYAHDVRVPGMLHGRVVRPPVINTAPERIDEDSVKQIP